MAYHGGPEGAPPNPRAVLLAALLKSAGDLAAAGDVEGARVAHEAAGKLLGPAVEGAAVVDLASERERRGR
jgi:hypothetical protein